MVYGNAIIVLRVSFGCATKLRKSPLTALIVILDLWRIVLHSDFNIDLNYRCLLKVVDAGKSAQGYSGFEVTPQAVAHGFECRLQVTIAFHIKVGLITRFVKKFHLFNLPR